MKKSLSLLMLMFAGCQSAPVASPPAPAPAPRPVPVQPATAPAAESKLRQQAQYIEALLSQNDALSARLNASPEPALCPSSVARALMKPLGGDAPTVEPLGTVVPTASPNAPAEATALVPNAEGVIDLTAVVVAAPAGEPVNPFAVRATAGGAGRDVTLLVGGIISGPVACATINDRLLQAGETVEGFAVDRIEGGAVLLRRGVHRLRLPLSGKPVRVRIAP